MSRLESSLGYRKVLPDNTVADVTSTAGVKAKMVLAKVMLLAGGVKKEITIDSNNYTGTADVLGTLTLDLSDYVRKGQKVTVTLDVEITNSQALFKEGYLVYGTNTASVTTETKNGKTGTFKASGGGQTQGQIKNKRVDKKSSFNTEKGEITYTIKVNPWAANMGKVELKDILDQENAEYDDESFQLYEGINEGNGNLTPGTLVKSGWSVSIVNNADGSKQAEVIINNCAKPYVLEYKVMLLDGVTSPVINNVALFSDGKELDSSECSVSFGSWGDATGGRVDKITVKKLYKNPATGTEIPLAGARFGLIKNNKNNAPGKTVVSDANGEAVFKGLALDRTYWVVELEAPEGYEKGSGETYEIRTRTAAEVANNENIESVTWKCYNTRSTGEIEFTKVDENDKTKGLGGAGFLLYYTEGAATKLVKTKRVAEGTYQFVELVDRNADLDADQTAAGGLISSASAGKVGNVKVTGIPWGEGTYYFVEVQGPNGYKADTTKQYKFTVRKVDGQEQLQVTYDTASAGGKFVTETVSGDTRYTILNSGIKAYLRKEGVDKTGQNTGLLKDDGGKLTLTLYEKQNGKWIKVQDFKPDNVQVTVGSYNGYSNDISQYLQNGKEYKIVETKPHSSMTYMKAKDYYFKVTADGKLYPMTLKENGSFTTAENPLGDPAVIVMQDEEATMSIQNHCTYNGIFACSLEDGDGNPIFANETLNSGNEGNPLDIIDNGIDVTSGASSISLYKLQIGEKYILTSTYYLTQADYTSKINGYSTTIAVTCNDYGQLMLSDGRALTGNTFHIYGAMQIAVKKVAADGALKGMEIPEANLMLLQDGTQAPTVDYNSLATEWSWETDGYKPVTLDAVETTDADGTTYAYENPDGNLNARTGYVAGVSEATVFTLRETDAPPGYKRAADINFAFDGSGNIKILSGNGQLTVENGIVTITMKDEEGSDSISGQSDPHKSHNDVEAVVGTNYSADEGSSDTDSASSTVQLAGAETDVSEQSKREGRNVKTEDKTPIVLYLVLAVVTLGAFVILTLLIKKKKSNKPQEQ